MPSHEAIVSPSVPKDTPKPIPIRTVSTRGPQRQNLNQPTPSVGTAQGADSPASAESVRLAPQLTALARKEQAYRQREQALKEREKALEAKLSDAEKYTQFKTKVEAKDFSAAEELGLTYDEHLKYALDKQQDEDPTTQKFKALEDEIQALKKGREESAAQEYEETVAEYRNEIAKLAETDPAFAKVKKFKESGPDGKEISGVDVALQFVIDSWEEDGEEVSVEDAVKLTDGYLTERAKRWAALIEEPKAEVEEPQKLPPPKPGQRTLTQTMQPTGATRQPQKSLQHLSESERYAEARRRVEERRLLEGR